MQSEDRLPAGRVAGFRLFLKCHLLYDTPAFDAGFGDEDGSKLGSRRHEHMFTQCYKYCGWSQTVLPTILGPHSNWVASHEPVRFASGACEGLLLIFGHSDFSAPEVCLIGSSRHHDANSEEHVSYQPYLSWHLAVTPETLAEMLPSQPEGKWLSRYSATSALPFSLAISNAVLNMGLFGL